MSASASVSAPAAAGRVSMIMEAGLRPKAALTGGPIIIGQIAT